MVSSKWPIAVVLAIASSSNIDTEYSDYSSLLQRRATDDLDVECFKQINAERCKTRATTTEAPTEATAEKEVCKGFDCGFGFKSLHIFGKSACKGKCTWDECCADSGLPPPGDGNTDPNQGPDNGPPPGPNYGAGGPPLPHGPPPLPAINYGPGDPPLPHGPPPLPAINYGPGGPLPAINYGPGGPPLPHGPPPLPAIREPKCTAGDPEAICNMIQEGGSWGNGNLTVFYACLAENCVNQVGFYGEGLTCEVVTDLSADGLPCDHPADLSGHLVGQQITHFIGTIADICPRACKPECQKCVTL